MSSLHPVDPIRGASHRLQCLIRGMHSHNQLQQFMMSFMLELQSNDIQSMHRFLCTILSLAVDQRLVATNELQTMVTNITSPTVQSPGTSAIMTYPIMATPASALSEFELTPRSSNACTKCTKSNYKERADCKLRDSSSLSRSLSLPLLSSSSSSHSNVSTVSSELSESILDIYPMIQPVSHILDLPDHILSYCCSYLAMRDLLLSVDLCNLRMCNIARMPSSFHGKFIFGSAIHREYHKLITNNVVNAPNDGPNDLNYQSPQSVQNALYQVIANRMLQRFRHSKEIHFVNIFNDDTIQMLKSVDFSKMKSIYLYDRFNRLVEHLPALIPNVANLTVSTKGGNETLDMIQANVGYYSESLSRMFEGYARSMKTIDLRHNTFYDIPLMLPERVTKLLLEDMDHLDQLALRNVYFPPDLDEYDNVVDTVNRRNTIGERHGERTYLQHLELSPYNEYCANHFNRGLRSLSMHWNVVGENDTLDMGKLCELEKLRLFMKADNESLDVQGLQHLLARSECLEHIQDLELVLDFENAVWSATEKVWGISQYILDEMGDSKMRNSTRDFSNDTTRDSVEVKSIKIVMEGVCRTNFHWNVLDMMMVQMISNMAQQIEQGTRWNVEIEVQHCLADLDGHHGQVPSPMMTDWIGELQNVCRSTLEENRSSLIHTRLSLSMSDEVSRVWISSTAINNA